MPSLIEELQRDSLDSKTSVTELLQKCLVVGSKLKIDALADWARLELEGYKDVEVPEYRHVSGFPQILNPARGYQPLNFMNAQHLDKFSTMHFNQSIGVLEHSLRQIEKNGSQGFHVSYSPEVEIGLRRAVRPLPMAPSLLVDASQFHKILHCVRNTILEWSLKLEAAGIRGDGMSFSREEKERAQTVTIHIQNSKVANLNLGSQVGTINAALQSIFGGNAQQQELASALEQLTQAVVSEATLQTAQKQEVMDALSTIAEQAAKKPEERSKGILKAAVAWLPTAVSTAKNIADLWDTLGPIIQRHLGI